MVKTFHTRTPSAKRNDQHRRVTSHHTSYANRKWRALCLAWLQQYPLCVLCACMGKYNDGMIGNYIHTQRNLVVDHIEPHHGDESLFWEQTNLETLCRMPCHDSVKRSHERSGRNGAAWYEMLRNEVIRTQARLYVESMRRWLPEHVVERVL